MEVQQHTIDDNTIKLLCEHYHLGMCIDTTRILHGGALHQCYLLETIEGPFVVKRLNNQVMRLSTAKQTIQTTELIAQQFSKNIPCITALNQNKNAFIDIDATCYMVFPYIKARTIKQAEITEHHVKHIAQTLSLIHQQDLNIVNAPPPMLELPNLGIYFDKVTQPLIDALKNCLTHLAGFVTTYPKHKNILKQNLIIGHRDLDPKNVLWDEQDRPTIIDWEYAGLINRTKDLWVTAIYWSLNERYQINQNHFQAFLAEYVKLGLDIHSQELEAAFSGMITDWLVWLDLCLANSLDDTLSKNIQQSWEKQAMTTLQALPMLYRQQATCRRAI